MAEVELESKLRLEDLVVGSIFDGDELIIGRIGSRMITIRRDEEEIRTFSYLIMRSPSGKLIIDNDGYFESNSEDKDYPEKARKLQEAGL